MQLDQIVIRPEKGRLIIQYSNNTGRRNSIAVNNAEITSAAALIAECQQRMPQELDEEAKSEVEQEIDELEYRLKQLEQSIGIPV